MPLTFPPHAAAVMPLKLSRPRWFDGVALVVGSAAPDLPYAAGAPLRTYGHTWTGLVVWCVPLTVAAALLIRLSAPVTAAHLPGPWRAYGVLGAVRHPWYVTVSSAWLGAVTHRLWDDLTHDQLPGTTVGFAALGHPVTAGVPWWVVLHTVSSAAGLAGWIWASVHIGRHGLLHRWHGAPPLVARRPALWWTTVCATAAGATALAVLLPSGDIPIVLGTRLLAVPAAAFAVGAGAVRLATRRRSPGPAGAPPQPRPGSV
ncbi:DUF4184 family protein [Streptomyces sp. ID05-04B]|uniref:DUF4184 family protein n=1 Tax=unclassified Streptomyces TaxID=2593676 RepID=UPI00131F4331|nr:MULTISPECIES: DUF4184 family protein [unclassified Streptomyces]MDX5568817.1 DUF4184 family protein [Streptomyces sp. ID05-04B]